MFLLTAATVQQRQRQWSKSASPVERNTTKKKRHLFTNDMGKKSNIGVANSENERERHDQRQINRETEKLKRKNTQNYHTEQYNDTDLLRTMCDKLSFELCYANEKKLRAAILFCCQICFCFSRRARKHVHTILSFRPIATFISIHFLIERMFFLGKIRSVSRFLIQCKRNVVCTLAPYCAFSQRHFNHFDIYFVASENPERSIRYILS